MAFDLPTAYVATQPALRHAEEMWTGQLQLVWCPAEDSYTVSVTVLEGTEQQDLRSQVVGAPVAALDLAATLRIALGDLLDLERRTRNPFDDLT